MQFTLRQGFWCKRVFKKKKNKPPVKNNQLLVIDSHPSFSSRIIRLTPHAYRTCNFRTTSRNGQSQEREHVRSTSMCSHLMWQYRTHHHSESPTTHGHSFTSLNCSFDRPFQRMFQDGPHLAVIAFKVFFLCRILACPGCSLYIHILHVATERLLSYRTLPTWVALASLHTINGTTYSVL